MENTEGIVVPQRRRHVLASLVPVKTREDPLSHDQLPWTDTEVSSALLSGRRSNQASTSRASLADSNNQHDDALAEIEERLVHARRQWTEHQDDLFALQITARIESEHAHMLQPQQTLLHQLVVVEQLIQGAGIQLAMATKSSEEQVRRSGELYAQAVTHLKQTLEALHRPSTARR